MGKYLTKTGLTKYTTKLKEYISKAKVASAASADNATKVNNHTVNSDVPANAKFTDTDTWRPQPDWNATSGDAAIKNKPTSMPASDVPSWAKQKTKPTYTASEIGLGNVGNFKAVSTVANQGLTDTEKSNARANIGAGTSSFSGSYNDLSNKPTIPSVGNGTVTIKQAGTSKGTFTMNQSGNTTIELTDNNTTYGVATSSALGLVKSGTDITVDSSGNVSVNDDSHNHVISNVDGLQNALNGKAASNHTHSSYVNQNAFSNITVGSTTVSADNATDTLTLVAGSNVTITPDATNDKITISATDTNTWRPLGTTADTACAGNDSRLSNARPASDVYAWAKASTKPTYSKSEVGLGKVDNTADADKSVKYAATAGSATPIAHASNAATYGKGTDATYGHVKLSDTYTSSVGDASSGVAASQKALFDAYSTLNSNLTELIKIKMYNTQTNNIYEYFDAIEGYMPIAVIYGSPSSNNHCTGFNKNDWVDSSATGNYVAWFADKIGAGSKYIVVYIKIN